MDRRTESRLCQRTISRLCQRVRQIVVLRYKEKFNSKVRSDGYANVLLEDMAALRVRTEAGAFSCHPILLKDYLLLISVRVMLRSIDINATPHQKAAAIIDDIQFVLDAYGIDRLSESESEWLIQEFIRPLSQSIPEGMLGVLSTTIYTYCKIKVQELHLVQGNQGETLRLLRKLAIKCEQAPTYPDQQYHVRAIVAALGSCQLHGENGKDQLDALKKEVWNWISSQLLAPVLPLEELMPKRQ